MQLRTAADLNAVNTINLQQALSRIQDADIAQVTSDFARTKALIDAGATISSQAKAAYESILLRIYSGGP
jgi:flagellin-like hook-associated protein FlgL